MATMGPLFMSIGQVSIDRVPRGSGVVHSTRPAKNGFSLRSASSRESAFSALRLWDIDRTVGLEVLLAGGGELDGGKLVPTLLEAGDDGANESALDTVGLDGDEAVLASVGQFLSLHAGEGSREGAWDQGMAG